MKLLASLAVVIGLGIASAAQAMPAAPLGNTTAPITEVGWRCGPGWHVNPWGRCVPNRRFYRSWGYYGAPRFYGPRFHRGWRHHHYRRW